MKPSHQPILALPRSYDHAPAWYVNRLINAAEELRRAQEVQRRPVALLGLAASPPAPEHPERSDVRNLGAVGFRLDEDGVIRATVYSGELLLEGSFPEEWVESYFERSHKLIEGRPVHGPLERASAVDGFLSLQAYAMAVEAQVSHNTRLLGVEPETMPVGGAIPTSQAQPENTGSLRRRRVNCGGGGVQKLLVCRPKTLRALLQKFSHRPTHRLAMIVAKLGVSASELLCGIGFRRDVHEEEAAELVGLNLPEFLARRNKAFIEMGYESLSISQLRAIYASDKSCAKLLASRLDAVERRAQKLRESASDVRDSESIEPFGNAAAQAALLPTLDERTEDDLSSPHAAAMDLFVEERALAYESIKAADRDEFVRLRLRHMASGGACCGEAVLMTRFLKVAVISIAKAGVSKAECCHLMAEGFVSRQLRAAFMTNASLAEKEVKDFAASLQRHLQGAND